MGFDPRAAVSSHRTEQTIAPYFLICFASGCHDQSEYTMNIFYIVGVVLFIAGFFGLHA